MEVSYKKLLTLYETEIRKNVKNKRKLFVFEINKMALLSEIEYMLNNGLVGHKHYNIFVIFEPKCRLVMSLSVRDKLINHYITRNILEPNLTKYLDDRNVATRKNMGSSCAIKKVIKYIRELKHKCEDIYVLKIDIKKYFYNIDHIVLKKLLKEVIKEDSDYELVCKIIDSTNEEYINEYIEKMKDKYDIDIPYYEHGKGLPIGNLTSQFLSVFYLYKLDHYIVHDLKLKYYVRYMDDFIIIDKDKEKLNNALQIIIDKLKNEYHLDINNKKTFINNLTNYVNFLGYNFKIKDNKLLIHLDKKKIKMINKKIKLKKQLLDKEIISHNAAFGSIMTYYKLYKFSNNKMIIEGIDRYFYNV